MASNIFFIESSFLAIPTLIWYEKARLNAVTNPPHRRVFGKTQPLPPSTACWRSTQESKLKNWKDEIELLWTLRDIYGGRLKLLPITEDQLQELLEMGLAEVIDDHVKLTDAGYRKIN
ncbi:hypothetical protein [Tardiphaga sp. 839_C3_N1_4]|uniref:hypothetical protein n=1 Tax=Tardiphaga sp. 839_C3_N1_4 TaxID=3240761 RepID=UPI003F29B495